MDRKRCAKQRRAAAQPTFSKTVLVSCYEATLLWRGQTVVDEAAAPWIITIGRLLNLYPHLQERKDERHYDEFKRKAIALKWWEA